MSTSDGARVLAIGIDAAEVTLVKRFIELDEMPTLKSLSNVRTMVKGRISGAHRQRRSVAHLCYRRRANVPRTL